jgi:hypothetical protein
MLAYLNRKEIAFNFKWELEKKINKYSVILNGDITKGLTYSNQLRWISYSRYTWQDYYVQWTWKYWEWSYCELFQGNDK